MLTHRVSNENTYSNRRYCASRAASSSFSNSCTFASSVDTCSFNFSFSLLNVSTSESDGAPKNFFINLHSFQNYSMEFAGFSGCSQSPTSTRVSWSITPLFSKYFLNSSFLASVVYHLQCKDACAAIDLIVIRHLSTYIYALHIELTN